MTTPDVPPIALAGEPVAMTKEQIAKESLGLDWRNVESQARSVCGWAADLMSKSGKRATPNLDGDWSPISETLVHRLRDPIPAQALADMPERMSEAINVIREEAADAIENLCAQYRELEYSMECSQNAKAAATLNLNLASGWGDGGLLDASIEAQVAAPSPSASSVPVAITFEEWWAIEWGSFRHTEEADARRIWDASIESTVLRTFTDEQITKLWYKHGVIGTAPLDFARAILQANGAKHD